MHVKVPGVQAKGRGVEEAVGVDVEVGEVVGDVVREVTMVVKVAKVVGRDGEVVEMVDVAGSVGNDGEVVNMKIGVVVKILVALPVNVSMVPFVSGDPVTVAVVGPVVVEELPKGKGGVNVGMLVVVCPEDPVPVAVVVTAEPPQTSPWPDSRGTVS